MKAKGAQNKNKSISVPQYKICVQISKRSLSVSPEPPCRRPTVEREGWKAEGGWEAAPGPGAGGTSPLPGLQSNPPREGGAGALKKMQTAKNANCKMWREAATDHGGSSPLAGP